MFKSLLSETMKKHQYENEDLKEYFLETEHNTKLLLQTDPNEITEDSFLNVEELNKILKHASKSCPRPDKIIYLKATESATKKHLSFHMHNHFLLK